MDPVNGMVMMTGNSMGDIATYTCDQGYELVGAELLTCQSIGAQWSDSPPECKITGKKVIVLKTYKAGLLTENCICIFTSPENTTIQIVDNGKKH